MTKNPREARTTMPHQPVIIWGQALDFELLPGLDVVLLPELGGQDDLALVRNAGPHEGKMTPYSWIVNDVRTTATLLRTHDHHFFALLVVSSRGGVCLRVQ